MKSRQRAVGTLFVGASLVLVGCNAPRVSEARAAVSTSWPASQQFPSFAPLASPLDLVSIVNHSADEIAMMVTLQGIVNRTQPRIWVDDNAADDALWRSELGATVNTVADPYSLLVKYRAELAGIVITDDAQPDTLNLATTIAGAKNAVVSSPALSATLMGAPYNLPVVADLRSNHFASKLDVYEWELDNYASQTTHRLIIGLTPSITGNLRDYAVATNALAVWLDPRNGDEKAMLDRYLSLLPANAPYLGWWADEPSGVSEASSHGVPVYAADWSANLTVLGGAPRGSAPTLPPPAPPPLENKIYVAIFMSDGDNLQEDEGLIPLKWADGNRGNVPISWTVNPALVDAAPSILRYYQRTATANDVLVAGPSGLGYTYPAAWPSGTFTSYAQLSGQYMSAAGLRVVTVWNNGVELSDANANAYVDHVPNLLGMTIQDANESLRMIESRVPLYRLNVSYGSDEQDLENGIDAQLGSFNGTAPVFIAVQGDMNMGTINPTVFNNVQQHYTTNTNVVFVRGDHLMQLMAAAQHIPQHRMWRGDFNGDGKSDVLMYYASGDFWMGLSNGSGLVWHNAGNVSGFGDLLDGRHDFWCGDFNGDGKADLAFYFSGDGNWWLGQSDGNALSFRNVGNTKGFGNLLDGKHRFWSGDFTGDGKTDVLFHYSGDGNWWLGVGGGTTLSWRGLGSTSGFGNLLDGAHVFFDGDFNGDGKRDVMFHYDGDQSWWMGISDGNTLAWHNAGNTGGFGTLVDPGHRLLSADFTGDGKTDVLMHFAGDGNWWMGVSDGNALAWHLAASTNGGGMGDVLDWYHRVWTGDFDGDGKSDVLVYDSGFGNWFVGRSDGTSLAFHGAGNTAGFGDLDDPSRVMFLGDFSGDNKIDALFYYSGDGNWWQGDSNGSSLTWQLAGNTAGFGDLTH